MLYESSHFRLEADDRVLTLWLDFRGRRTQRADTANSARVEPGPRPGRRPAGTRRVPDPQRPAGAVPGGVRLGRTGPVRVAAGVRGAGPPRAGGGAEIAALPFPTAALVEGRCAGAGLELALACDHRWAVATPHTRFEFPEADRGLIPCWGGTVRLPRLIGVSAGLRVLAGGEVGPPAGAAAGIGRSSRPARRGRGSAAHPRGPAPRPGREAPSLDPRDGATRPRAMLAAGRSSGSRPGQPRPAPTREAELRRVIAAGLGSEGEGLAAERAAFTRLATGEAARRRLELHRLAAGPVPRVPGAGEPRPAVAPPGGRGWRGGPGLATRLSARPPRTRRRGPGGKPGCRRPGEPQSGRPPRRTGPGRGDRAGRGPPTRRGGPRDDELGGRRKRGPRDRGGRRGRRRQAQPVPRTGTPSPPASAAPHGQHHGRGRGHPGRVEPARAGSPGCTCRTPEPAAPSPNWPAGR